MQARVIRRVRVFDGQVVQPADSLVIDDGIIRAGPAQPAGWHGLAALSEALPA